MSDDTYRDRCGQQQVNEQLHMYAYIIHDHEKIIQEIWIRHALNPF